jgi:hypothetical protein
MNDVAIITCRKLPEPDPDEALLLDALAAAGLRAVMHPWDAEPVNNAPPVPDARIFVLRSTWNYYHALEPFLAWVELAAARAPLYNDARIIRWNADKAYLRDLAGAGIGVVPTAWVEQGSAIDLGALMREHGWSDVVVKPRISAGSFATTRHLLPELTGGELGRAAAERPLMVQPYVKAVDVRGERSYVFIDGQVSHAIRKSPRLAGQEESVTPVQLDPADVLFAERVVAFVKARFGAPPLYARVDVARDDADAPVVMELELIEPSLFFVHSAQGLARMVAAVAKRVQAQISARA